MRILAITLGLSFVLAGCAQTSSRLPDLLKCSAIAKDQVWGTNLLHIPSTVIDKGVLRDIPYSSLRSDDYELNVYGDPIDPCCVELGIYNELVKSEQAKQNCIEYILAILYLQDDRSIVRALNLQKDTQRRSGLTFEVTPETAEDSYGGWWVSVYDEQKIEKSRGSRAELDEISESKVMVEAPVHVAEPSTSAPTTVPVAIASPPPQQVAPSWTPSELKSSRPSPSSSYSSSSSSSSGRVYVKGYYRKNGTYVRPYTRSRSRR